MKYSYTYLANPIPEADPAPPMICDVHGADSPGFISPCRLLTRITLMPNGGMI